MDLTLAHLSFMTEDKIGKLSVGNDLQICLDFIKEKVTGPIGCINNDGTVEF